MNVSNNLISGGFEDPFTPVKSSQGSRRQAGNVLFDSDLKLSKVKRAMTFSRGSWLKVMKSPKGRPKDGERQTRNGENDQLTTDDDNRQKLWRS